MNLLYDGAAPRRGDVSHPPHPRRSAAQSTQGKLATLLTLFALLCGVIPLKPWVLRTRFSP